MSANRHSHTEPFVDFRAVRPSRERLGLFGGTFDPVHIGHLVAASEARHQLQLDRVLFVVAGDPWQKRGVVDAPAEARYEMVTAALGDSEGFEVSRIELDREGPTYTIDTVEALASPGRELFLIVGADAAAGLDGWKRADALRRAVTVAVVSRATDVAPVTLVGWEVVHVSMPRIDVSSTELRERVALGVPVDFLVPAGAVRVIRARHLYTPARSVPSDGP
jgi:nicotinate-nucleotide adenylyltransferase